MIGRVLIPAVLALALGARAQDLVRIVVGPSPIDADAVHVAGLDEALAAVRDRRDAERQGRVATARIEIVFGPGTHERTRTAEIGPELGGTPEAPLVIRGLGARLVGARRIPAAALRSELPADVAARLPSDPSRVRWIDLSSHGVERLGALAPRGMGRATVAGPTELFWNGRALPLARWPDAGFATVDEVVDPGTVPRNRDADVAGDARESGPERGGTFRIADPRVERWTRAAGEAWLEGYWHWDWADELLPLQGVDPATHRVTLGLPHHYGLDPKGRFFAVNVLEELDRPGECWLDPGRDAMAVMPPDDDPPTDLLASVLGEPLLWIHGADNVVVRDLELGFTRGTAIRVDGGAFVTIEDCHIAGTGGHGIELRGLRHRVARCTIEDVGASGVVLDGGDRATLTPGGHVVEDCEIARFARCERTYRPAIAVAGVGHRVAHNRIHDAPHSAILVSGNEHVIEANEIYRVLLETGDCGAIYMGRDWAMHGTAIRHNLIRDLPGSKDRWQNAIYLDDMASGITVEGNVLLRCNLGMLIGGGRSLAIRHNVFVDCGTGLRFDARGVGWMAKDIAAPSTSTLHQRLAGLPIDRPPWSLRYPDVQRTLTVGLGRPIGSSVTGNAFFRTPFGEIADTEAVAVSGNRSLDKALDPLAKPELDVRDVPGFPPIPVGTIGPRTGR